MCEGHRSCYLVRSVMGLPSMCGAVVASLGSSSRRNPSFRCNCCPQTLCLLLTASTSSEKFVSCFFLQANEEFAQLMVISRMCGTPCPSVWPEVTTWSRQSWEHHNLTQHIENGDKYVFLVPRWFTYQASSPSSPRSSTAGGWDLIHSNDQQNLFSLSCWNWKLYQGERALFCAPAWDACPCSGPPRRHAGARPCQKVSGCIFTGRGFFFEI